MQSEQLGCVAVLAILGLIGVLGGVSRAVQSGVDWFVIVGPLVGLGLLLSAFLLLQARRTSPLPEFTVTTHAYHLISDGAGSIEAYCLPLCSRVRFVTVLTNGLYNNTVLEAYFGSQKVVLSEILAGPQRDRPWEHERFGAFLSMMESAMRQLAQGQWSQVPGADLLPGEPPRPTAAPANWRVPPETQPG